MQNQAERTQETMQKCADTIAFLFDDLRELKGLNSHLDKCILRNLNELTALRNIIYREITLGRIATEGRNCSECPKNFM